MFSFRRSSSSSAANTLNAPTPAKPQPETKEIKADSSESGGFFSLHEISSNNVHNTKADVATVDGH